MGTALLAAVLALGCGPKKSVSTGPESLFEQRLSEHDSRFPEGPSYYDQFCPTAPSVEESEQSVTDFRTFMEGLTPALKEYVTTREQLAYVTALDVAYTQLDAVERRIITEGVDPVFLQEAHSIAQRALLLEKGGLSDARVDLRASHTLGDTVTEFALELYRNFPDHVIYLVPGQGFFAAPVAVEDHVSHDVPVPLVQDDMSAYEGLAEMDMMTSLVIGGVSETVDDGRRRPLIVFEVQAYDLQGQQFIAGREVLTSYNPEVLIVRFFPDVPETTHDAVRTLIREGDFAGVEEQYGATLLELPHVKVVPAGYLVPRYVNSFTDSLYGRVGSTNSSICVYTDGQPTLCDAFLSGHLQPRDSNCPYSYSPHWEKETDLRAVSSDLRVPVAAAYTGAMEQLHHRFVDATAAMEASAFDMPLDGYETALLDLLNDRQEFYAKHLRADRDKVFRALLDVRAHDNETLFIDF
jgi:hypothetical protein